MTMTVLSIEGRRDVYDASEIIDKTMTVGELISYLEDYPSDMPVILNNDNGYTYGSIRGYSIEEEDIEVDEEEEN